MVTYGAEWAFQSVSERATQDEIEAGMKEMPILLDDWRTCKIDELAGTFGFKCQMICLIEQVV